MFSEAELAYLQTQRLTRVAMIASNGQPTVDVVGFEFNGTRFYIGGLNLPSTRKYRNVAAGNRQVALVVDDLPSINPWTPRGIKVHGTAEIVQRDGSLGPGEYLTITLVVSLSWDILADTFQENRFAPHRIQWQAL
jgi:pyridoxamine 5'-phosphate oxidase family protein